MSRRTKLWVALASLVLLFGVGFLFKGPRPAIHLPAERLAGPFGGGFYLTNTILAAWLTVVLLLILLYTATGFRSRGVKLVPAGLQNVWEALIEAFLGLAESITTRENARRFTPLVLALFLFIAGSSWLSLLPGFGTIGLVHGEAEGYPFRTVDLGPLRLALLLPGSGDSAAHESAPQSLIGELIPFFRGANTDLNTTLALALISFLFVEWWGIRAHGWVRYGGKFLNLGSLLRGQLARGVLDLFIGLVETITELLRIVSLAGRLFGNMLAGELLVLFISFFIPFVLVVVFYGFEVFVGFVQALVFAMLTLVFAVVAVSSHEETPGDAHGSH